MEREGESEGEKHQCQRETWIHCLSYMPQPQTKRTTQACALTRNRTGDLSLCRMMPKELSHTSWGTEAFLGSKTPIHSLSLRLFF